MTIMKAETFLAKIVFLKFLLIYIGVKFHHLEYGMKLKIKCSGHIKKLF